MTDSKKYTLTSELEKQHLKKDDYVHPSQWPERQTSYMVDVMALLRSGSVKSHKTFGKFIEDEANSKLDNLCKNANRIDFVFDAYLDGSVKDSERARRSEKPPIEINSIDFETPLPTDMDTFWGSASNKRKLQDFYRKWLVANAKIKWANTQIVLSGTGIGDVDKRLCVEVIGADEIDEIGELMLDIEEADMRLMPHMLHAVQDGAKRVVCLSNDTDVIVLSLHHFPTLRQNGLQELWIRAGIGDTTRYLPIHTLAMKMGRQMCSMLPAAHALTGNDIVSKLGTKASAVKAGASKLIKAFGKRVDGSLDNVISNAEEYLVKLINPRCPYKTMDELRYYKYHQAKNITIADLPPTSYQLRGHILRALYSTHLQLNCMQGVVIDPRQFGFEEDDNLLVPSVLQRILPGDFPHCCTCGKCATARCTCRSQNRPCCMYCKCQGYSMDSSNCKNPIKQINLVLRYCGYHCC